MIRNCCSTPVRRMVLAAPLLLAWPLAAAAYDLDSLDRVRVTVSEWSSSSGEPRVRLNGEFTVDAGGMLSLPLIGQVPAQGRSPEQLGQDISDRLQSRAGLINAPVTAVEIVQYRPFYIAGFVDKPGEYAYRPGLSVMQAVAIAGGTYRAPFVGPLRLGRDTAAAEGEIKLQQARIDEYLVRRARIRAELNGQAELAMPAELSSRINEPALQQLVQQETATMRARRDALAASLREQREMRRLAEEEEASLRQQLAAQEARQAVVDREAEEIRSLRSRGLTTTARDFAMASAAAEVEARKRALATELLRAGQSIVRADQTMRALQTNWHLDLLADAERTRSGLDDAQKRLQMAQGLLDEAEDMNQIYGTGPLQQASSEAPSYILQRRSRNDTITITANEMTAVEPGDVLRVLPPARLRRSWEDAGLPTQPR
ncbi:polysaccharide biosynthesis/export family protein [Roseomonas sp. E05]|uniref:polysaccharide biosynthesis/export family protein n=1 Tax=Roseomonas sp. E05 TaxID=3046310 RepID=UPI0024BA2CAE|nr:polysaccharide biosynthesis/export family protein [Roseomonas sp. E05]MDJ0390007.1 polysaccharide biosynthesis/export family protein [Roseomonas sp. E05]